MQTHTNFPRTGMVILGKGDLLANALSILVLLSVHIYFVSSRHIHVKKHQSFTIFMPAVNGFTYCNSDKLNFLDTKEKQ